MTEGLVENVWAGHLMGWSFTPLVGKKPVLKGWQSAPHETLQEALGWAAKGNVGLRTGRISGVVVIDADPGADLSPLSLPETVTALTGRPGARHLYFHHDGPLGNSSGQLGPHIDVKADGGQVVFAGSVHPETGVMYRWADGHSPAEIELVKLPAHIRELLRKPDPPNASGPEPTVTPGRTREERYAAQALRLELNNIHNAVEGARNDTLNKAAFSLGTLIGGGSLDRKDVEDALRQAALAVGLEQPEVDATINSGIESGLKHPRQPGTQMDVQAVSAQSPGKPDPVPRLPAGRFALDLYGNADRFVHIFGQDVHWCDQHGRWYVWNGKCWKADEMVLQVQPGRQALEGDAGGGQAPPGCPGRGPGPAPMAAGRGQRRDRPPHRTAHASRPQVSNYIAVTVAI
jgi:hypothetical protein